MKRCPSRIIIVPALIMITLISTTGAGLHTKQREEVREMFHYAYDSYMQHAFPMDELLPLTCEGVETWGDYSLTLIDTLDTLIIMGNHTEFYKGVDWVSNHITWHQDVNISIFETNIRVLGGLLSAHLFAEKFALPTNHSYDGKLLDMALELGEILLPAFDTPTGIPYGAMNLKLGVSPQESRVTSVAGGGTFLIEFGALSRLTNDDRFERAATKASLALWNHRSSLGLIGNHVNIFTGEWPVRESGLGGGADSFYEYLIKGALFLEEPLFLEIFQELQKNIYAHLKRGAWYVDVDMFTGSIIWPIFNSLQAFWPGMEILAGSHVGSVGTEGPSATLSSFHSVWRRYGYTPEGFNLLSAKFQAGQKG
eukprot:TRINITY_DN6977_c0_g1_i2.p1 TRINITY_DN6977_c0_g1~~TRINITY_DN6977_c0_g1_i2.p1  ORF type:complete len:367 (+),score=89.06 TRINITY_DN6977_c0_g1_i2:1-1101(+)